MKKGLVSKLGATALVLSLVTASLVGGTFAKYVASVTGKSSTAIAKFAFDVKNGTNEFNETMALQTTSLQPGDSGTFVIQMNTAADAEIGVDYVIATSKLLNKPTNLNFYTADTYTDDVKIDLNTYSVGDTIAAKGNKTVTLYWNWPESVQDSPDVAAESGKDLTFDIAVTGTQTTTQ